MIKPKAKACKGIGKAAGVPGCGNVTVWRTYGLCDACLYEYYNNDERGRITIAKTRPDRTAARKPIARSQKPIAKESKKRRVENLQYQADRIVFLGKPENRICPVTGEPATEIHHKKGRIGSLLLNQKYWLAVSRKGHQQIEACPEWAKENGFSLDRLSVE